MSIRERMEQIQEDDANTQQLRREQKEEQERKQAAFIRERFPEALKDQAKLLEDLREHGIIAMIEEMTKRDIPPIITDPATEDSKPIDIENIKWPSLEKVQEVMRWREWSAEVQTPGFNDQGWDGEIQIITKNDQHCEYEIPVHTGDRAIVVYSKRGFLNISGGQKECDIWLPSSTRKDVQEEIEYAFARAFVNPKRNKPRGDQSFDPNTPIGVAG